MINNTTHTTHTTAQAEHLGIFLKAWQEQSQMELDEFKEAADFICDYLKQNPVTDSNAGLYMLNMATEAYHAGKTKGSAQRQSS